MPRSERKDWPERFVIFNFFCKKCGAESWANKKTAIYCSTTCRVHAWNDRHARSEPTGVINKQEANHLSSRPNEILPCLIQGNKQSEKNNTSYENTGKNIDRNSVQKEYSSGNKLPGSVYLSGETEDSPNARDYCICRPLTQTGYSALWDTADCKKIYYWKHIPYRIDIWSHIGFAKQMTADEAKAMLKKLKWTTAKIFNYHDELYTWLVGLPDDHPDKRDWKAGIAYKRYPLPK